MDFLTMMAGPDPAVVICINVQGYIQRSSVPDTPKEVNPPPAPKRKAASWAPGSPADDDEQVPSVAGSSDDWKTDLKDPAQIKEDLGKGWDLEDLELFAELKESGWLRHWVPQAQVSAWWRAKVLHKEVTEQPLPLRALNCVEKDHLLDLAARDFRFKEMEEQGDGGSTHDSVVGRADTDANDTQDSEHSSETLAAFTLATSFLLNDFGSARSVPTSITLDSGLTDHIYAIVSLLHALDTLKDHEHRYSKLQAGLLEEIGVRIGKYCRRAGEKAAGAALHTAGTQQVMLDKVDQERFKAWDPDGAFDTDVRTLVQYVLFAASKVQTRV